MLRPVLAAVLIFALSFAAQPASADVGPPDTSCTVEKRCAGQGVECRYVNSQPDAGDLKCVADAESRGMVRVCSRGGGTVGVDIYCPKGTGTKPSSGCAAAPGDAGAIGGFALLGLVVAAGVRRRARR